MTERFRVCTPGELVYGGSRVFAEHGSAASSPATQTAYLCRVGFRDDTGGWVRQVPAA